tara:strand:- start:237 stop:476 length:240 start_codon:yes stop_codon:yes gene_type:complete
MKVIININLKNGVLDPQGEAISSALKTMGFKGVNSVRQGKTIELDLDSTDPKKALKTTKEMCENLLSNTVIEDYFIEIV